MGLFETTGSFIMALGKTIIHSLWIGFLIFALLRMLLLAIPERHSNQRYLLSVASMLFLTAAVFTTFSLLYAPGSLSGRELRILDSVRQAPLFLARNSAATSGWEPRLLFSLCSYLYFAGMIFVMLRSAFSFRYLRSLRNSGQVVQEDWLLRMKQISISMGIRRKVSLLQSDRVDGPLLIGILKPAVIVPVGMFTHLSVSQVESILIHELYHLKRLDYLVNIMQLFMEGLLFYNPALWLISDRIRREREHSCDDAVVQTSRDPLNYAKALVRLAEHPHYIRLAPGAGGNNKYQFVARIRRIINQNNMKKNTQERVISLLLFAGAIMVVIIISGFSSGFSIIKHTDNIQEKLVEPVGLSPEAMVLPLQDTIRAQKEQEKIKEDMEAARIEAMEEIDWDQIKEDMKTAQQEAMAEMDFDMDLDIDFDMESIRKNMEEARKEMREIDWEELKLEMDEIKKEIEESIQEIDWDEIREDIENSWREADSLFIEKDI